VRRVWVLGRRPRAIVAARCQHRLFALPMQSASCLDMPSATGCSRAAIFWGVLRAARRVGREGRKGIACCRAAGGRAEVWGWEVPPSFHVRAEPVRGRRRGCGSRQGRGKPAGRAGNQAEKWRGPAMLQCRPRGSAACSYSEAPSLGQARPHVRFLPFRAAFTRAVPPLPSFAFSPAVVVRARVARRSAPPFPPHARRGSVVWS